ncbi:AAA family ATPase, partial [Candidatus Woesearchaeota archaeon]|nr:AAA family ATPase [Candidatus Woesearchaeota archaeon]
CPEKLQNALLQVLEEKKATIGSHRIDIESDFIFIGTMNPQDSSTEQLSEVFMDRFDIAHMGYPEEASIEEKIVEEKGKKIAEFPEDLLKLTVSFVRELRASNKISRAPSVRATIGLYERAQANALLRARKKVQLEDVKDAMISVLAHRLELKPSVRYSVSPEQFVAEEAEGFIEKGGYR